MKLNVGLQSLLKKNYEPNSVVEIKFKGNDVAFKTDESGNPIVLFIGKKLPNGKIKGDRYVRTLLKKPSGEIVKDHWDLKGKAD
jgi:hypothetical protein